MRHRSPTQDYVSWVGVYAAQRLSETPSVILY
nr:MAG TPA: hypothetical protein [Caudoviricetes sp.]